jgi:D-aspartate ligase
MKEKVIALGCSTGGLAVIRALGKRGLHVVAMSHDPKDIGLVSKYAAEAVVCPHPNDEEAFLDFLLKNRSSWPDALIIESGDYYAVALSKLKDELTPYYRIITQDWDVLSQFLEKKRTYELAELCGIQSPKTYYPESLEDLEEVDEAILPCIIKPIRSHEFVAHFKTKLFVAHTLDELRTKFSLCLEAEQPVIVQEIVPGDDQTFERVHIYLNSRGEPGVEVHHNTFRLSPPKYGVMRAGITVPPSEEARSFAYQLLDCAGYDRGVAAFQFKRSSRTNELVLIEVNGRIPRSVQIDIASGIDMPWIIYRDMVHDEQLPLESYPETIWIEFWPDVLNAIVRDNKKTFKLGEFIKPYMASNRTFAILSPSDLRPFLRQTALLPKIARRKLG